MYYYSFNQYLRERFGERVHRISLNAGFECPNWGRASGMAGCIFCNEAAYTKYAGTTVPLHRQIEDSIKEVKRKIGARKFIAYFQNASGTNAPADKLKSIFDIIKAYPEIVGLAVSTRPDCIDDEKLDLISGYAQTYETWIEYGLQTAHDRTLRLLNRGHTFSQAAEAASKTAARGIKTGVHVILGLPGESARDMLETARKISALPVAGVKLHVLHVLKGTKLEELYHQGEITLLNRGEYVKLVCDFLERLRPGCVVHRLVSNAREEYLVAPSWINGKALVKSEIEKEFTRRNTYQGSKYLHCCGINNMLI